MPTLDFGRSSASGEETLMTKISTLERTRRIDLLDLVHQPPIVLESNIAVAADEGMGPLLAKANTYAFATVVYPGASISQILDSNATTAVGGFAYDLAVSGFTAFTFANGA